MSGRTSALLRAAASAPPHGLNWLSTSGPASVRGT